MISIILPVHNDQKNLNRMLIELRANKIDLRWELIVVDDGSSTPLTLGDNPLANWQIIRHEFQRGAATSRNSGVKQAGGEFLILLSIFLKIPKDYLSRVSAFIESNQFDFAQHLLKPDPGLSLTGFQVFLSGQKERLSIQPGTLPIKNSLFTAAIIKKEVYCHVKGFDESMNHYGGHEIDLVYRLDQAGFKNRRIIPDFPLQRVKIENHKKIQVRLQEYGKIGLPALLKKHPELKKMILLYPGVWSFMKIFGLPKLIEERLAKQIEQDIELSKRQYRLYLHLLVRNAWDAR